MDWRKPFLAGLWVASIDIALAFSRGWNSFLTSDERYRFAFAAISSAIAISMTLTAFAVALFWGADRTRNPKRVWSGFVGIVAALAAGWLAWELTSGRRVQDASWREGAVLIFALGSGCAAYFLIHRHFAHALRPRLLVVLSLLSISAFIFDVFVFNRLYPAFHWALCVLGFLFAMMLFWKLPLPRHRFSEGAVSFVGVLCAVVSLPFLSWLAAAPNASFVTVQYAPFAGKIVPFMATKPSDSNPSEIAFEHDERREGIDLRERDILLITIDALRADRLGAYGGQGITPHLDRFSEESMVFLRAYTPTPHTSYALTSLLTGKYLKPVLELPNATNDHPALPELLRNYGYRTAAFYPPAIFFVDAHRFQELARRDFGFEYRKVMFAPAHARGATSREVFRRSRRGASAICMGSFF